MAPVDHRTQEEIGNEKLPDLVIDEKAVDGERGDDAAAILGGHHVEFTEAEERSLLRKTDWILISMFIVGAGIISADKNVLSAAATLTLQKDLNLQGSAYSWAVSVFYFGVFTGTYPMSLVLQRYHVGRVVGSCFIAWGIVTLLTMFVRNAGGLFACRFLLGVFESAGIPAFTLTTARFYTQKEQPLRYLLWGLGNTFPPIPLLLIFYGLGRVPATPLEPWRWFYTFVGGVTIFYGIIAVFVLPDRPDNWRFYSQRQREIATLRIAREQTGIKAHVYKKSQVFEALRDPKTWMIALMIAFQQPAPTVAGNFQGLIIKGYGYTGLQSLVLQIPGWIVASVVGPALGLILVRFKALQNARTLAIVVISAISLVSEIVLFCNPPVAGVKPALVLAFVYLMNINLVNYSLIMNLVGSCVAGTTKKQTVMTVLYMMYCVSDIATPQAFKSSQSPRYQDGIAWVIAAQGSLTILAGTFYVMCKAQNKARDKAAVEGRIDMTAAQADDERVRAGLSDLTDKENPLFRYRA